MTGLEARDVVFPLIRAPDAYWTPEYSERELIPTRLILAAATWFAAAIPLLAQEPLPPCSAPEYRQLDFWVGEWNLEYDRPDGTKGEAANSITRNALGDCVITENFAMPNGYRGTSHSIFDREARKWRQMWVDNGGGVFSLEGGPVEGQPHAFELRTVEPTGPDRKLRRMIWENVRQDSLVWRWQSLEADGRWKDTWVLTYRRKEA